MSLAPSVSIPVLTVFAQGLLSFFSPCVLPLLPLYMGYLTGTLAEEETTHKKSALPGTLFFVLGISAAFFLLGLGITAAGGALSAHRVLITRIGGVLILLFGLAQLGLFGQNTPLSGEARLPFLQSSARIRFPVLRAFLMGFFFSFAWTPCVGPALTSVLLMAGTAESRTTGLLLIGVYTLGFALPFLAAGLFTERLLTFFKDHREIVRYAEKAGALLLIILGLLMLSGQMSRMTNALAGAPAASPAEASSDAPSAAQSAPSDEVQTEPPAEAPQEPEEVQQYPPAFDFALYDQNGELHSLSDYEGKIIFLNFWATWCPPCRAEMPDIQALYEENLQRTDSDVVILGVAGPGIGREGSEQDIIQFLADNGYTYPVLMDKDGELLTSYQITAFPTTFMIDTDGRIYGYVTGSISRDIMDEIITMTRDHAR